MIGGRKVRVTGANDKLMSCESRKLHTFYEYKGRRRSFLSCRHWL